MQNNLLYVHLTGTIAHSQVYRAVYGLFYRSAFGYNASREAKSYSLLHKLRATRELLFADGD
jgi:hypothetical protein